MDKLALVGIYRDRSADLDNAHLGDRDAGGVFHPGKDGRCAAADLLQATGGKAETWIASGLRSCKRSFCGFAALFAEKLCFSDNRLT